MPDSWKQGHIIPIHKKGVPYYLAIIDQLVLPYFSNRESDRVHHKGQYFLLHV